MQQATLEEPPRTKDGGYVPPLKWAGGKRWLVPHLQPIWAKHSERRLVEPFAGGLAVTLGLEPKQALLNDINEHVINFYRHLRAGLVCEDIDHRNEEETYYSNRETFNWLISEGLAVGDGAEARKAAQLFYYLNRHCYNGLCRFNRSGGFNTPMGRYKNPKFHVDLRYYSDVLSDWDFVSGDFEDVQLKAGDFVYADPPYDDAFTAYSEHAFGYSEQKRLAEWLAGHDGPVVLSNHATEPMLALYDELGFNTSRREPAPRMIHCFGDRTPAVEVIATLNID